MTDAELQTIADQIDECENSLQEWEISGDAATAQLPWLHSLIVQLMDASAQTTDDDQRRPRPPCRSRIPCPTLPGGDIETRRLDELTVC